MFALWMKIVGKENEFGEGQRCLGLTFMGLKFSKNTLKNSYINYKSCTVAVSNFKHNFWYGKLL